MLALRIPPIQVLSISIWNAQNWVEMPTNGGMKLRNYLCKLQTHTIKRKAYNYLGTDHFSKWVDMGRLITFRVTNTLGHLLPHVPDLCCALLNRIDAPSAPAHIDLAGVQRGCAEEQQDLGEGGMNWNSWADSTRP